MGTRTAQRTCAAGQLTGGAACERAGVGWAESARTGRGAVGWAESLLPVRVAEDNTAIRRDSQELLLEGG